MELGNTTLQEQIETLEQDVINKQKKLVELKKQAARREVPDYELQGAEGQTVALSSLFGDKEDLIVIHNMGVSCPYCTLWADGFNGVAAHLQNRAAFVLVSPDTPEVQQQFAASRNWKFPLYSAHGSTFSQDMGYSFEKDGKAYQLPGFSTFRKMDDGSVVRVGADSFGPGDVYSGIWHLFALLEQGAGNWQPRYHYAELPVADVV